MKNKIKNTTIFTIFIMMILWTTVIITCNAQIDSNYVERLNANSAFNYLTSNHVASVGKIKNIEGTAYDANINFTMTPDFIIVESMVVDTIINSTFIDHRVHVSSNDTWFTAELILNSPTTLYRINLKRCDDCHWQITAIRTITSNGNMFFYEIIDYQELIQRNLIRNIQNTKKS